MLRSQSQKLLSKFKHTRPELRNLIEIKNGRKKRYQDPSTFDVTDFARQMLLPVGYPYSVHPAYKMTHIYQFMESIAGSMISVLGAEAMLTAVGAGSPVQAGTASVAIQWVLKVSKHVTIVFIYR